MNLKKLSLLGWGVLLALLPAVARAQGFEGESRGSGGLLAPLLHFFSRIGHLFSLVWLGVWLAVIWIVAMLLAQGLGAMQRLRPRAVPPLAWLLSLVLTPLVFGWLLFHAPTLVVIAALLFLPWHWILILLLPELVLLVWLGYCTWHLNRV